MSVLFMSLLIAAGPVESEGAAPHDSAQRPFHEINNDLRKLMRRELRASSTSERAAAIVELAELYRELREDPRLAASDTLKSYKAKLWSRLTRVKQDLKQQMARQERLGELSSDDDLAAASVAADSLATQLSLVESSLGGPASLFGHRTIGYGGGPGPPDHGAELVALIERTIAPDKWESVGGPFSIYYYRPLHALVVRATAEVHHRIGGAVGGLRGAGP